MVPLANHFSIAMTQEAGEGAGNFLAECYKCVLDNSHM